ncbi:centrosomal protein of 152 kDa-like [Mytilus californianus]|uniref:centrosomal protein of 152 kDa-like n=1 Tax=Mytilus californianus TaxID=6549 RepID=UPI0022471279|nr:centrosomal protein of 152 kDa-like [Mytilus californianus]XP_052084176.1 centrosomal protein of 152 kDa-like [Mytilus californianus]
MSNMSGTSINFDGQALQNIQEAEYRKEEEEQEHELRQLLTNAFDDLMEDDEFSVTSDEGNDSRNSSIHIKNNRQEEDKETEQTPGFVGANGWGRRYFPGSTSTPLPTHQEVDSPTPYDTIPPVRQSKELPTISTRQSQDLLRQSQEMVASSLRRSQESVRQSQEMLRRSQEGILDGHDGGTTSDGYHSNSEGSAIGHVIQHDKGSDWLGKDAYNMHHHGNQMNFVPTSQIPPSQQNAYSDLGQGYGQYYGQQFGVIPERQEAEGGNTDTGHAHTDHYSTPIYAHQQHQFHPGFYRDTYQEEDQPRTGVTPYQSTPYSQGYQTMPSNDLGYHTVTSMATGITPQSHNLDLYSLQQTQSHDELPSKPLSPRKQDFTEDYKVQYKQGKDKENEDRKGDNLARLSKGDNLSRQTKENFAAERNYYSDTDSSDNRQYQQLQALYKARGRKLEEITEDLDTFKAQKEREHRILKHQLSIAQGEKAGASTNMEQLQNLLVDSKADVSQVTGKLRAAESQVESLQKSKDELMRKLQATESTIESMSQQLTEMGNSDSLARARHEHERVIACVQQKYDKEIKVQNEKIDELNGKINDLNSENETLRLKLDQSYKAAENAQISRAETINRLTRSLEDSQKQCQALLESTSSHELSQVKIQLQQAMASRKISDEMCQTYQDEIKDLKEQLNMFEAASALGVLSSNTLQTESCNDSLSDLGIRKTLDFQTPDTSVRTGHNASAADDGTVHNLRCELERCLLSNKEKRIQVSNQQEELRKLKREMGEYRIRCERAEKTAEEYKGKVQEWEDLLRTGDKSNAIETRLKKEAENLRREKVILNEDIDELKKRLNEAVVNEEKLTEINNHLNQQISQMVKDYDQDKREALDRCQKTCESVHEKTRDNLRKELTEEFSSEKANLIKKYENDCNKLRNDLNNALQEVDDCKTLYVKVCEEKDKLEVKLKEQMDESLSEKLKMLKEKLEKEKETEITKLREEVKDECTKTNDILNGKIREQLKKEFEVETKKTVETEIAMAKVKWFEEQKVAKQTAVENAVKLAESEWQSKLETALETEVDIRVQEAKEQWTKERQTSFDKELQSKLTKEKENIKIVMETEFEKTLEKVKEEMENEKDSEVRKAVEKERVRATNRAEVDREVAVQKEEDKWKLKMEKDLEIRLEKEKTDWEENNEIDVLQKIHEEKLKWNRKKDIEIKELLEEERTKWQNNLEKQTRERQEKDKLTAEQREMEQKKDLKQAIEHARREWEDSHEYSVEQIKNSMEEPIQERISAEVSIAIDEARKEWLQEKQTERSASEELSLSVIKEERIKLKQSEIETLKDENSELIDKFKQKEEQWKVEKEAVTKQKEAEFKKKLEQEISEFQDQHDKLVKEHHETLTEALKQAREKFFKEVNELKKGHEEEIQKYKVLLQKEDDTANDSFRRNMESQRIQWEEEKSRLEQEVQERDALLEKADSHLSHEIEKLTTEMEKAYQTKLETEINTARQKFDHESNKLKLQDPNVEKLKKRNKDLEEENKMVLSKYEMLKTDTEKFRSEVDKVVRENQKVKFENQKVQLDNQKAKADGLRMKEENQRITEENKNMKNDLDTLKEENKFVKSSLEEVSQNSAEATENYKKSINELNEKLRGQSDQMKELDSLKQEVETLRQASEKIKEEQEAVEEQRKNQGEKYEKCRSELLNIISEKEKLVDNIRNLETAYKKDLAAQKQKQDEVNEKLRKTEKAYHETKRYYRNEMEKIKRGLETENNSAMDTMKSKMVDMQHSHKKTLESMKRQFQLEYTRINNEVKDLRERSLNSTEVQTDSEDLDEENVMQIRGQYLDTVTKIKEDVMKHITETNMRAAETVRCEMLKERNATLKQLKQIYMDNVRKVLQNEIIGLLNGIAEDGKTKYITVEEYRANIESKLSDIEQALELISVNSSRSHTPRDEISRTNTPTPRSSSIAGSCERFPVGSGYRVSDINIDDEKENGFRFKPNILSNIKSGDHSPAEANITVRERNQREANLGRKSPRELTRQSPRDVLYSVQEKLSRSGIVESDTDKESYEHRPTSSSSRRSESDYDRPVSSSSQRSEGKENVYSSTSRRNEGKEHVYVMNENNEKRPTSGSSRRSRHEDPSRVDRQERKSSRHEPSSTARKSSKNVHFTPTKDLSKNLSRHENGHSSRTNNLQHFDSIHSGDSASREYLSSLEAKNAAEEKFSALDPRPNQKSKQSPEETQPAFTSNRTPRDYLSPRDTAPSIGHQQSSLFKARSQPELGFGFEQPFSLRESGLGSYKYTSLRDALGKTPVSTSSAKNSSISQEDLRSYPINNTSFRNQKALSVDIGLHHLGLERSPRKFNPSPEKLAHDAGESPMGTPRLRRKIAPLSLEREENMSSQERVNRDFNRYHGGTKTKPVRNLVEQFSGVV